MLTRPGVQDRRGIWAEAYNAGGGRSGGSLKALAAKVELSLEAEPDAAAAITGASSQV